MPRKLPRLISLAITVPTSAGAAARVSLAVCRFCSTAPAIEIGTTAASSCAAPVASAIPQKPSARTSEQVHATSLSSKRSAKATRTLCAKQAAAPIALRKRPCCCTSSPTCSIATSGHTARNTAAGADEMSFARRSDGTLGAAHTRTNAASSGALAAGAPLAALASASPAPAAGRKASTLSALSTDAAALAHAASARLRAPSAPPEAGPSAMPTAYAAPT
mmetsp:Transcript_13205/g.41298  ORF Transcript_13205/g.41298 Transcript_13205/m.41298 type:complete len:220 (-) Transcript_13205:382-1041(-)